MFASAIQWTVAAASEEGSGADLLLPATSELIAGIIAFAIIFFFAWKWVFPQISQTLESRQAAVRADYEAAESAKVDAEKLRADYQQQLSSAREEANRIVEEARQAGESARADIVSKAQDEAAAIKAEATSDLDGERERVASQLRGQVAGLSLDVAEKVVGRSLDRAAQQQLVEQFIDDLGGVKG